MTLGVSYLILFLYEFSNLQLLNDQELIKWNVDLLGTSYIILCIVCFMFRTKSYAYGKKC